MNHDTIAINTDNLPFGSQQAFASSHDATQQYLAHHALPSTGLNAHATASMAVARLDWLLQCTRPKLSGLLSRSDVEALMNCFQGDLFSPAQTMSMTGELCSDLGIEALDWRQSSVAPLASKLLALDAILSMTLADALEQAWHRGISERKTPDAVFAELGIELID